MYCTQCGKELYPENKYCTHCRAKIIPSNQPPIQEPYQIKPTHKFIYMLIRLIPWLILYMLFTLVVAIGGYTTEHEWLGRIMLIMTIAGPILIIIVKSIYNTIKYKNTTTIFEQDKLVYHKNFLNIKRKEIKYKDIKELILHQTFLEKRCNLGTISILIPAENYNIYQTNATGLYLTNIENAKEVYQKIKQIVKE